MSHQTQKSEPIWFDLINKFLLSLSLSLSLSDTTLFLISQSFVLIFFQIKMVGPYEEVALPKWASLQTESSILAFVVLHLHPRATQVKPLFIIYELC